MSDNELFLELGEIGGISVIPSARLNCRHDLLQLRVLLCHFTSFIKASWRCCLHKLLQCFFFWLECVDDDSGSQQG